MLLSINGNVILSNFGRLVSHRSDNLYVLAGETVLLPLNYQIKQEA